MRIFYSSSFCPALFCFLTHLSTCSAAISDVHFLPLAVVEEEDLPAWLAIPDAITLRISAGSLCTEHGISLKLPLALSHPLVYVYMQFRLWFLQFHFFVFVLCFSLCNFLFLSIVFLFYTAVIIYYTNFSAIIIYSLACNF